MQGFAGFDRSDYPGKAAMDWLKANTNLRWCGFYLGPAPSHPNTSWMDADDADFEGWGFAPIYVGQETAGPGSHVVTAVRGTTDGQDACKLMTAAGFDLGSVVYLDLENPDPVHQAPYVAAWIDAVKAGGFSPGAYTSFMDGKQIAGLRPGVKIWVFHVPSVIPRRFSGKVFPTPDPKTSGFAGANVWQLFDAALIDVPGFQGGMLVDLNSADSADLSKP